MSLVPDYDDSSESSSDSDSDKDVDSTRNITTEQTHQPPAQKLPTPNFLNPNADDTNLPKTSVFHNAYVQAENEKKAILERHVKMVNTKDNVQTINGKKICWNYRKGKCRFGHNCIYAHDSDLQKTKEQLESENQVQQTVICQNQSLAQPTEQEMMQIREEGMVTSNQKRKRPGLSQGLVPGKKVMKNYLKLKK